jgi:hypothetical protein
MPRAVMMSRTELAAALSAQRAALAKFREDLEAQDAQKSRAQAVPGQPAAGRGSGYTGINRRQNLRWRTKVAVDSIGADLVDYANSHGGAFPAPDAWAGALKRPHGAPRSPSAGETGTGWLYRPPAPRGDVPGSRSGKDGWVLFCEDAAGAPAHGWVRGYMIWETDAGDPDWPTSSGTAAAPGSKVIVGAERSVPVDSIRK